MLSKTTQLAPCKHKERASQHTSVYTALTGVFADLQDCKQR
jgi:hypothetical protein